MSSMQTHATAPAADEFADWLTMDDVKRETGLSERSVYRLVDDKTIRKRERPVPKRKPLPIFHPGDVADYKAKMIPATPVGMLPAPMSASAVMAKPNSAMTKSALSSKKAVEEVAQLILNSATFGRLVGNQQISDTRVILPPSELRHKQFLNEDEAVAYTGLGKGVLAERLKSTKYGSRGARVYRRADLEAL